MSATVVGIRLGDDPARWTQAGFDVRGDAMVVGTVQFSFGITDGPSWVLARSDGANDGPATIDGVPTVWATAPASGGGSHPNGCNLLDHVVIATPDVERTATSFEALGMRVRGRRDAGPTHRPMRQVFVRDGAVIIEIVGPAVPAESAAERDRPAALWGLAFTSDDLDAAATRLGPLLGPVRDAVQPGRRIASLRQRELGISVPVAIMTR